MKFSEHLNKIDETVQKEKYEKKKREIFGTKDESAEELYIKSSGDEEE